MRIYVYMYQYISICVSTSCSPANQPPISLFYVLPEALCCPLAEVQLTL